MAMKKLIQETEITSISAAGEILNTTNSRVIQIPREPAFVKLYIEDLSNIYKLPKNSPELLYELLKKLDYEGLISLNSSNKKRICEQTGKALKTLDNFLSMLVDKDVFRRVDRGIFSPNPHLFGRGEWRDIYKRREAWLKVEYDDVGGKKVTSSLDSEI
jgi:hypothetical protein